MKRTLADMKRLLPLLLEEWDSHARIYRQMADESRAALRGHCDKYEHEMHFTNELRRDEIAAVYEKCANSLRVVLGLDPQPTAAKPEGKP